MRRKKTSPALVVGIAFVMVVLFLFGFLLRETVFMGYELYEDSPIPALPFVFLFDSSFHDQLAANRLLDENRNQAEQTENETLPEHAETDPVGETNVSETEVSMETAPVDQPLPVYVKGRVKDDYFDDALFIGDSRTDGLFLYSRFEGADYFSGKGMTMFTLFDKPGRDGKTMLLDMLEKNTYGKIYIMLGLNEIGNSLDALEAKFAEVIGRLKELAPEAIVVIQANLSVDEKMSSSAWYFTVDRIHELNDRMAALADGERVFYLDANPIFCDGNGYLKEELSGDGVHLYAKHYAEWTAWLLENAFVPTVAEDE